MTNIILRRRKLGRTSCREIARMSGLTVVRNDQVIPKDINWMFRWGCTSQVDSKHTVNTAAAIGFVNDKIAFRKAILEKDLCMETYFFTAQQAANWLKSKPVVMKGEWVARPPVHSQGKNLYMGTYRDCVKALHDWGTGGYISKYIKKEAEYRVFVVQGRVAWVAKKTSGNPEDVAWNVAKGGRFDNVRWDDWPLKAVRFALEAAAVVPGLTFGGVDVMVAGNDCYVLEINSGASQTSPYRQECVAKCFKWIVDNNSKADIPRVEQKAGCLKFIHPAVCNKALVV